MKAPALIIALLLFSFGVYAQEPAYKNYTTSDGLPSNNIYSSIQDDDGFIWFATDNGVSRFDGTRFRNYSKDDSLTDRNVISMAKDSYGRIWFFTFSGNIFFYAKGKIYNRFNSELIARINARSRVHNFYEDSKRNIWLSLNDQIVKITPANSVKCFGNIVPRVVWEDSERRIHALSGAYSFLLEDTGFSKTRLPFYILIRKALRLPGDSTVFILGSTVEKGMTKSSKTILALYSLNSGRIKIDSINNYSSPLVQSISIDNNNWIWLSSLNGVSRFNIQNLSKQVPPDYLFFKNNGISSVLQDKDNNYWFTSFGAGIFIIPSLYTHSFNINSGLVENNITSLVELSDGYIMIGSKNGAIQLMKNGVIQNKNTSLIKPSGSLLKLDIDSKGRVWVLTDVLLSIYNNGKFSAIPDSISFYKTIFVDSSDSIWIGTGSGLKRVVGHKISSVITFNGLINRVYSIAEGANHLFWLGTDKGLYAYNGYKVIFQGEKYPALKKKISALAFSKDSTLWIATDDEGLFKIDKNGNLTHFTVQDGLLSNYCTNLLIDSNKIYLATNNGLNILNVADGVVHINSYSSANGLVSSHINQVIKESSGSFLMATDKGIIEFNEQSLSLPASCKPYIDAVYINDESQPLERSAQLHCNQNNIQVNFGAIDFNVNNGSATFYYKLSGIDTGWNRTTSNSVKYNHLAPGNYTFFVKANNRFAHSDNQAAFFKIYIETPLWLTWWFKSITALAILLIIFLFVKNRFDAYGKKINQQRQLAESELKALRAQINPHFIYNSLNSIQSFIVQNQREDANVYLSKFASLMRGILSHSRALTITLTEEIESLELYLELEAFLHNGQFTFNFNIDKQIDTDEVQIPSMILQPYIENAVIHGLSPLKQDGKISVSFTKAGDELVCTIEDNGIGRKMAAELKQQKVWKDRPSLGMKITQERIDLLSTHNGHKINLEITDLMDGNNNAAGTRIRIHFPFITLV